jgi:hypothetical protein
MNGKQDSTVEGKQVLKSKTLWMNLIATAALVVQSQTGFVIQPETQAAIIAVINMVLRFATSEEIIW